MAEVLGGRHVLVGVGGSVAAFKAGTVITELCRRGADVRVAMTDGAQHFITALTLQSLSGHEVATSLWDAPSPEVSGENGMTHLNLAAWADIQVVVAASANLLARLAHGFADDPVTSAALASEAPLLIAPAMETTMWQHPATRANVALLAGRGVTFAGPVTGRLASGKDSNGRMAEPAAIITAIEQLLGN